MDAATMHEMALTKKDAAAMYEMVIKLMSARNGVENNKKSYIYVESLRQRFSGIYPEFEDFRGPINTLWYSLLMYQCKKAGIPTIPDAAVASLKDVVAAVRAAFAEIGDVNEDAVLYFIVYTVNSFRIDTDAAFYTLRDDLEELLGDEDKSVMLLATHAVVHGRHLEKLPPSAIAASIVRNCGWHDNKSQVCVMNVAMHLPKKAALRVIEDAANVITALGAANFNVFELLEQVAVTMPSALKFVDLIKIKEQTCGRVFHKYIKGLDELLRMQKEMLRRLKIVQVFGAAWARSHGRPEKPTNRCRLREPQAAPLAHALSLRRFCRIRGPDELDMPTEVVEPFARDIAMYL